MYWILKAVAAVVGRLGSETIDRLARFLAWLVFDVFRIRRKLILQNLRIALGGEKSEAELVRIGRASVYNFALTGLEFFRGGRTDIAGDIEIRGQEHIRKALDEGRGVYVLCFHLGNWEAMGAKYSRAIAPAHVLVKKVGSAGVDRFVAEMREKSGFLCVKRRKKGDGYAAIKEILARGEIVGFVMDQARPGEPKLPFFGAPAKTNTSLAAIWQRVPAPVVPSYITRTGVSRHVLEILPPLELARSDDPAADVTSHSTLFNAVVERCVRTCPEQYFWMHNRWK